MSLRGVSQVRQVAVQRGSRSHLAAKNILVTLGQVFGDAGFSSRHASYRLQLDFLYTSKVLSRMAKQPYYYLSVVRVSRPYGGFENFPQNVNIPLYVMINRARGISPETILIALLIRGGKELCNELTELKAKPAPIEVNQTVTPKKDDSPLVDEKKRNEQLEKENASLTKELSDVRLEKFSLRLRNDNLCNHIVNVSRQISALSEDMNKIESPSMDAMALKGIVYGKLIPIAAMNILTHNSNKIDA